MKRREAAAVKQFCGFAQDVDPAVALSFLRKAGLDVAEAVSRYYDSRQEHTEREAEIMGSTPSPPPRSRPIVTKIVGGELKDLTAGVAVTVEWCVDGEWRRCSGHVQSIDTSTLELTVRYKGKFIGRSELIYLTSDKNYRILVGQAAAPANPTPTPTPAVSLQSFTRHRPVAPLSDSKATTRTLSSEQPVAGPKEPQAKFKKPRSKTKQSQSKPKTSRSKDKQPRSMTKRPRSKSKRHTSRTSEHSTPKGSHLAYPGVDTCITKLRAASEPQRATAVGFMQKVLRNIVKFPTSRKYRRLKSGVVARKFKGAPGALQLLKLAGFTESGDRFIMSPLLQAHSVASMLKYIQSKIGGQDKATETPATQRRRARKRARSPGPRPSAHSTENRNPQTQPQTKKAANLDPIGNPSDVVNEPVQVASTPSTMVRTVVDPPEPEGARGSTPMLTCEPSRRPVAPEPDRDTLGAMVTQMLSNEGSVWTVSSLAAALSARGSPLGVDEVEEALKAKVDAKAAQCTSIAHDRGQKSLKLVYSNDKSADESLTASQREKIAEKKRVALARLAAKKRRTLGKSPLRGRQGATHAGKVWGSSRDPDEKILLDLRRRQSRLEAQLRDSVLPHVNKTNELKELIDKWKGVIQQCSENLLVKLKQMGRCKTMPELLKHIGLLPEKIGFDVEAGDFR